MEPFQARSALAEAAPDVFTVDAALAYAAELTDVAPRPGDGRTLELWQLLAALGARDLQLARAVEPHLDAVAIFSQAGATALPPQSTWGVFAAEAPGSRLEARPVGDTWLLDGVKPWCSLAGSLRAALVTARVEDGRRLFAVDLRQRGVEVASSGWVARGLVDIPSGPVTFSGAIAVPVGEREWYLRRPGFAWGGIGVAACWHGGAVGLARTVHATIDAENPLLAMHLGAIDVALHASALALASAAIEVDAGRATGAAGTLLTRRVRAVVAGTCETVLEHAGHALGPAALAFDAAHAQRVADLTLYVRQHHAEKDLASLGAAIAEVDHPW